MAQQIINIGASPNDGQGNPIRTAFNKTNENFNELYARAQTSPPPTLVGSVGDFAGMYAYDSTYFYYCFANYDGSSTIWAQVTQVGNISVPEIENGTSNVVVDLNGNVRMGITGTANAVQFTPVGQLLTGQLSATGNVTGNFIIGDGSLLTNLPIPGIYGNTQVADFLPTYTGNLVSLTGPVTTTANVTGNYIIGDGSLLTNVNAANVVVSNIINGTSQVNIPNSSGNVVIDIGVLANLAVFSIGGLSVTGNIEASSNVVATGNVTAGNIDTTGQISATGNVTADYFIGDGSLLTNVAGTSDYGNANVAAYLPTYTGNLSAGNVTVSGQANITGNVNVNYHSRINGTVDGQLYGLTNGVNTFYGTWDFGLIAANTYNNPIQWIFAQTAAGNVDMGTVTVPASLDIDIGTIF
jgi:cytoskeletal protein CcmA (bactofilin family)